jgi:2,3-bisphosphoglycerate-independent phosphoglycerate mutase
MDGRDTAPDDGIRFMRILNDKIKEIGVGKIATVSGRYYAMDRDNRWERIKLAYDAIVYGKGNSANSPFEAIEESYKNNITDEFIIPTVILEKNKPICTLQDNDSVIFFNFRSDRARQLTRAIKIPSFKEFEHENFKNLKFVTFNEYDIEFNDYVDVAFRLPELKNILGEVMQNNKLKQLRLAETEKYAHVTFFFNGGVEKAFEGEDRILVPSPKVATYDLQPEMSAFEVKDKLVNALKTKDYDLIVTNFANCDMVGHTGVFDAAVKAVETIDICLGEILPVAQKKKYNIFITADHGNADQMLDENGNPFTAHSKNPVPFVVKLTSETKINLKNGILADIAPTILKAMKIEIPKEMTGKPLF